MDDLIAKLRPVIQDLQRLLAAQEPILHDRVNDILARRSKNVNEIDHLMDDLFTIMPHGFGIADFKRLKEYLATLDAGAADFYQREFEEWIT
jgi:hypothetical protein